jgi:hypothetical protein
MTSLWCVDCACVRVFEPVPDASSDDLCCTRCDAAVCVGEARVRGDRMPVAAVA